MLEKTLERPLDSKEIKPVSPGKSVLNIHWKDWCWSWSCSTLATWCEDLSHRKRPWSWEGLKAGGEEDYRGWDGCMASMIPWMCLSKLQWWTGRPGVLWSMGLQVVGRDERLNRTGSFPLWFVLSFGPLHGDVFYGPHWALSLCCFFFISLFFGVDAHSWPIWVCWYVSFLKPAV